MAIRIINTEQQRDISLRQLRSPDSPPIDIPIGIGRISFKGLDKPYDWAKETDETEEGTPHDIPPVSLLKQDRSVISLLPKIIDRRATESGTKTAHERAIERNHPSQSI